MNAHRKKRRAKDRALIYYSRSWNIPRYSKILRLGRGKRVTKWDSEKDTKADGGKPGGCDIL